MAAPDPQARPDRQSWPGRILSRIAGSSIMRDTSLVAASQSLFKGSLYLSSILLARTLSDAQFATFGYFSVTTRFLSIFFAAGLALAATKAFTDASADAGDRTQTAAVAALLGAALVVATALSPLYLPLVGDEAVALSGGWLLTGATSQAIYAVALAAMFGAGAFRGLVVPMALGSVGLLAGAALTAVERDVRPVLVGYIMSFLIPALLFTVLLFRRGLLRAQMPSRAAFQSAARTALPSLAVGIIGTGVVWLATRVLLANATSTAEFNKFVIGMQWFVLVLFLPNALGNALFPRFLHGAREGRIDTGLAGRVALAAFAAILLLAAVATVLTPLLSQLYGYAFSRAFVIAILVAAALAGPANMLSYPVIAVFGMGRWLMVMLVLLLSNVVLLTLLPPSTALQAALIMCAGNAAVLVIATAMLARLRGPAPAPAGP